LASITFASRAIASDAAGFPKDEGISGSMIAIATSGRPHNRRRHRGKGREQPAFVAARMGRDRSRR
jgi:hypothetical protein